MLQGWVQLAGNTPVVVAVAVAPLEKLLVAARTISGKRFLKEEGEVRFSLEEEEEEEPPISEGFSAGSFA